MGWILGILGAIFGLAMMADSRWVFGFVFGGLAGALLGMVLKQRSRIATLDQRLARLEAGTRRPAPATEAPPRAEAPVPVATAPAAPAAPAAATPRPGLASTPPATRESTPFEAATPLPPPAAAPAGPPVLPAAASAATAAPAGPAPAVPAAPADPDPLERLVAIAKGWLFEGNVPVKIGLLVLMFGVASALKYAADAGWLTLPIELRLAGIAAAAIAGLVWGLRSAPERPAFGLSLQGGAIGILLLVVFAAFRYYGVLPAGAAFGLVIVLVAGASVLAVRQDAVALAVLGFIGGYLAPVLISTGSGNHVALFSYYAVLNAAVFGIAWKKPWRALNLVGWAFTFAIGGLWGAKYYRPELFNTVEPFLVLFFLFYVAIPVLYALAGRERNGKVDGTLLFGTPLLAFPMQVALLDGERLPLAASAVAVAAIYAGLGTWAIRNPRLRTLAQSAAAMGVVFATLAIPLALEARWTSAAWALQGLGMVWLGLRQQRALTRWAGLGLLGLAAGALCVSLFDHQVDVGDRFLLNGFALNLGLLALTAFGASWLHDRAGRFRVLPVLLFLWGLMWWFLLGLREILVNLEPQAEAVAFAVFAAGTAALGALLRRPMAWPRAGWATLAGIACLPWLAMAGFADMDGRWLGQAPHWFAGAEALWWPVLAASLLSLAALRAPRSRALPVAHLLLVATATLGTGLSLVIAGDQAFDFGNGWILPLFALPLAAWLALAATRPALAGWPVSEAFEDWRTISLWLGGGLLALVGFFGLFLPGDSAPLAWLPVLNPLELMLVAGLVALLAGMRRVDLLGRAVAPVWGLVAVAVLSSLVLRACHQLAGLDWGPSLLGERLAQASLTIAWCLAGVIAWVLGSRRRDRPLWWLGAGLQGIVLAKLLLVDRLFLGNITGIASFVAVGMLLVIVGWLAPTPPRTQDSD